MAKLGDIQLSRELFETSIPGIYVADIGQDDLEEYQKRVQQMVESHREIEQELDDEDTDEERAEILKQQQRDGTTELLLYSFQTLLCDENEEQFEDVQTAEGVKSLGPIRMNAINNAVMDKLMPGKDSPSVQTDK